MRELVVLRIKSLVVGMIQNNNPSGVAMNVFGVDPPIFKSEIESSMTTNK